MLFIFTHTNFINNFTRIRKWSSTNWRFEVQLNITLKNNTIRCKKLATIVSGRKNLARPFVRRKHVSTSAEM